MSDNTMQYVTVKVKRVGKNKVKLLVIMTAKDGTEYKRTVKLGEGDTVGLTAFAIPVTEATND